jgi:hypothetical protein
VFLNVHNNVVMARKSKIITNGEIIAKKKNTREENNERLGDVGGGNLFLTLVSKTYQSGSIMFKSKILPRNSAGCTEK